MNLSAEKKLEIAHKLRNEFILGFQSKCKYIESLKHAEIFEDVSLSRINKSGWYGWIEIDNKEHNSLSDRFDSYYIGFSIDLPIAMTVLEMKGIAELVKKVDDEIREKIHNQFESY